MDNNIAKGKWNQVKGKITEESGKLTGNKSQEIRGDAQQVAGKMQEQYGKAERNIKKAIKDQSVSIHYIDQLLTANRYSEVKASSLSSDKSFQRTPLKIIRKNSSITIYVVLPLREPVGLRGVEPLDF